jgi:hypothetical protein
MELSHRIGNVETPPSSNSEDPVKTKRWIKDRIFNFILVKKQIFDYQI